MDQKVYIIINYNNSHNENFYEGISQEQYLQNNLESIFDNNELAMDSHKDVCSFRNFTDMNFNLQKDYADKLFLMEQLEFINCGQNSVRNLQEFNNLFDMNDYIDQNRFVLRNQDDFSEPNFKLKKQNLSKNNLTNQPLLQDTASSNLLFKIEELNLSHNKLSKNFCCLHKGDDAGKSSQMLVESQHFNNLSSFAENEILETKNANVDVNNFSSTNFDQNSIRLLQNLKSLDISNNSIDFKDGKEFKVFRNLQIRQRNLRNFELNANPFCSSYPNWIFYFYIEFYNIYYNQSRKLKEFDEDKNETPNSYLKSLNLEKNESHIEKYEIENMVIDKAPLNVEKLRTDVQKLKELLPPIESLQHPKDNKSKEIAKQNVKTKMDFKKLNQLLTKCLNSPSESTKHLHKIKLFCIDLLYSNRRDELLKDQFEEDQEAYFEDSNTFLTNVKVVIDNQNATYNTLIQCLVYFSTINQENLGSRCLQELSILAKRNPQFKKCIKTNQKSIALKCYKVEKIELLDENNLKGFVEIIKTNKIYDILDDEIADNIEGWLKEIYNLEMSGDSVEKPLTNANLYFDIFEQLHLEFKFLIDFRSQKTISLKYAKKTEEKFINISNNLMKSFIKQHDIRSCNKFNESKDFYIFINYYCKLIKKCVKYTEKLWQKVYHDNPNLSSILYNRKSFSEKIRETFFFPYLIKELDEQLGEINKKIIEKNVKILHLENSFSSCLFQICSIFDGTSKENKILIDREPYIRSKSFENKQAERSILNEIIEQLKNHTLSVNLRTIIVKFSVKTLNNNNIMSSYSEYDSLNESMNHSNWVIFVTYTVEEMEVLSILSKISLMKPVTNDNVRLGIILCKLIEFYSRNSFREDDENEYWSKICGEMCKKFNSQDREDVLFRLLRINNDDLKLAIMDILNITDINEFDTREMLIFAQRVKDYTNVSTGKNEEVLGTTFLILTKFIQFADDFQVKEFLLKQGVTSVMDTQEILNRNMERDLSNDTEEMDEKDKLSVSAIWFLKALTNKLESRKNWIFDETYLDYENNTRESITKLKSDKKSKLMEQDRVFREKNQDEFNQKIRSKELSEKIRQILVNEEKFNPIHACPVEIEKALFKHRAEELYLTIENLNPSGIVFWRIMSHLADLMGGSSDVHFNDYWRDIMDYEFKQLDLSDIQFQTRKIYSQIIEGEINNCWNFNMHYDNCIDYYDILPTEIEDLYNFTQKPYQKGQKSVITNLLEQIYAACSKTYKNDFEYFCK